MTVTTARSSELQATMLPKDYEKRHRYIALHDRLFSGDGRLSVKEKKEFLALKLEFLEAEGAERHIIKQVREHWAVYAYYQRGFVYDWDAKEAIHYVNRWS